MLKALYKKLTSVFRPADPDRDLREMARSLNDLATKHGSHISVATKNGSFPVTVSANDGVIAGHCLEHPMTPRHNGNLITGWYAYGEFLSPRWFKERDIRVFNRPPWFETNMDRMIFLDEVAKIREAIAGDRRVVEDQHGNFFTIHPDRLQPMKCVADHRNGYNYFVDEQVSSNLDPMSMEEQISLSNLVIGFKIDPALTRTYLYRIIKDRNGMV